MFTCKKGRLYERKGTKSRLCTCWQARHPNPLLASRSHCTPLAISVRLQSYCSLTHSRHSLSHASHNLNVRTVAPHLARRVAIVPEAEDVLTRLDVWHTHDVEDRRLLAQAFFITRRREARVAPRMARRVVAAGAVRSGRLWACLTMARRAVPWRNARVDLLADLTAALKVGRFVV